MNKITQLALLSLSITLLSACSTTSSSPNILSTTTVDGKTPAYQTDEGGDYFILNQYAENKDYGLTPELAIRVGGGPVGEHTYLNSLRGPNGETISYTRQGSCCPFEDPNLAWGGGLLDVYLVRYQGLEEPVTLFLNMYQEDKVLYIPAGFTAK